MDSIKIHNLGLPRIGQNRELKRAVESHWKGDLSQNGLEKIGAKIREGNRQLQEGFDYYPANDFSFYVFWHNLNSFEFYEELSFDALVEKLEEDGALHSLT